ncbi:MAG: L,D-transpeptidase family protein [Caldilineae bacterium]|nr:L,D-transpeptidase family protein [Caldilineae bacterium]
MHERSLARRQAGAVRRDARAGCLRPAVGLLLAGAALWIVTLMLVFRGDRLLPGTRVLGQRLGMRPAAAAAADLAALWEGRRIELVLPGASIQLAPSELGLVLDAPATALAAWHGGRGRDLRLSTLLPFSRRDVAPVLVLDRERADRALTELATSHRVAPIDAGVRISAGRAEAVAAVPGTEIDVAATLQRIDAELAWLAESGRLEVPLRAIPPQIGDATAAAAAANAVLASSLGLRLWDPVDDAVELRSIPPERWSEWVAVRLEPAASGQPRWIASPGRVEQRADGPWGDLDALPGDRFARVEDLGDAVASALNQGASEVTLRVYHRPRQHRVEGGETLASIGRRYGIPYPWIQAANPGLGDTLRAGQTLEIPAADSFLTQPIVPGKRIEVDLAAQRVRVYEAGVLRWDWPTSTGIDESPTAPGTYQVLSLEPEAYASAWSLTMPYFIGIYQPAPGASVTNGFHGLPVHDELGPIWAGMVGSRATYGCVLLDDPEAAELFAWAEPGVVVEIHE